MTNERRTHWRNGRIDLARRRTLVQLSACATSALMTTEALAQAASCVLTPRNSAPPAAASPTKSSATSGFSLPFLKF